MEKIAWITGAGGLIGSHIAQAGATFAPGWKLLGLTRGLLDLENFSAVEEHFRKDPPSLVIHCAAISKSPACQADPARALEVNFKVTEFLALLCGSIPFYFFSSDLVFDGRQGNYTETDAPNPLSVYAETKVAAEQVVLANPKHTVIRTSLNAGISPTGDRGFNEEMIAAWRAGKPLRLFVDEFRSPIAARVTARAVWELVGQNATGLFHLGGSERLSRYEIGTVIASLCPELNPRIEPASLREYKGAPRPPDTSLNCEKIKNRLSFELPGFSQWASDHPGEINLAPSFSANR